MGRRKHTIPVFGLEVHREIREVGRGGGPSFTPEFTRCCEKSLFEIIAPWTLKVWEQIIRVFRQKENVRGRHPSKIRYKMDQIVYDEGKAWGEAAEEVACCLAVPGYDTARVGTVPQNSGVCCVASDDSRVVFLILR